MNPIMNFGFVRYMENEADKKWTTLSLCKKCKDSIE